MSFVFCIECGSSKIENRDLGLCSTCNKARRDKENTKPKIIKQVKKVSEKRAEELKEYPKLKKNFLLHKMVCEFKFEGCKITATQIHHCSLSAKNFLNPDTWMGSCDYCHPICENMSAEERRRLGYLID